MLVGFLTGVGIQVAAGQLPDMLGVTAAGGQTLPKLVDTVRALPRVHWADVAVSIAVLVVVVIIGWINRRIPGPLIAVIVVIAVSWASGLTGHGVAVVGAVPRGLPSLALPALGWHDAEVLLGAAVSMFVVILTQSAATSRAYAAKYEEPFSEATDLVGLAAANAAAAFTGTFVVNGSPTKTQIADSAGGRSQLSRLTASAGARTEEGLVVYRFGTSLYYANASRLLEDVAALVGHGGPLRWLVIDCAAVGDVDYTASAVLAKVIEHVRQHHVHLALSAVLGPVRHQLDEYGISKALGNADKQRH
ncbi:MAG TPA: SulP family inorganic anion transporter [Streptosporangiaceae bacterium]|nr:SulP family inorganic anion transporter [Streptosporangiaceae bacterium]